MEQAWVVGAGVGGAGKGRDGPAVEVTTAKAKEMGTTDAETGGGLGGVEGTGLGVVEGAMNEVLGQAVADPALVFMGTFERRASPRGESPFAPTPTPGSNELATCL
jgi:hypothetical protein